LRNAALELLAADPHPLNVDAARRHFENGRNMTEEIGGLVALMLLGGEAFETAQVEFYERWKGEPLVIDKWFQVQARDPSEGALGRVLGLTAHPAFDPRNPNRLRALVQAFASLNPARFHDPGGAGYRFLADQILAVDAFNPNVAARLIEPLGSWARYTPDLGALMREQLSRIAASPGLSNNVLELALKALE
jgi:aminopeptidase N